MAVFVGVEERFVVVSVELNAALSEESDYFSGKARVVIAGCRVEDVETHAVGRQDLFRLDTLVPDIPDAFVLQRSQPAVLRN